MLVAMERRDYSESQSLSDSTAAFSEEEGDGGSGGSSSCIRYLSFMQGLTSSWRKGRKRERERDHQYCSANTYMSYGKLHVFLTNLPYLEVIQGMELIVRVLSLIHP